MTIIDQFLKVAQEGPSRIALASDDEGVLSYHELDEQSNYVAAKILMLDSHHTVGVFLKRSFKLIISMLGIMKAGHSYLPIDPSYPMERINWMISNSNVDVVICDKSTVPLIKGSRCKLLVLEDILPLGSSTINLCTQDMAACILYTSGSTGLPNGVTMTHAAIMNTLAWAIAFYELSAEDVDLQVPSCSFTSSVQDIFSTLLSGGQLVLLNETRMLNARYLNMLVRKYRVTHFDMVPSLYKEFLHFVSSENRLRFVLLAGEPLQLSLVKRHFARIPSVRLINEYGMAETCSCCMAKEIYESDESVSIGKPISNMGYTILAPDAEGVGELCVSGCGLALGYYNNPQYTTQKFVTINGVRSYLTGDFVKLGESGDLLFMGRKDNQLKVNGKRINLSEIDYVIQRDDYTIDSLTTAFEYKGRQLVVSFIRALRVDIDYYHALLSRSLPPHGIPDMLKVVDDYIYLPNKKIDIKGMITMLKKELDYNYMKTDLRYIKLVELVRDVSSGVANELEIDKDLRLQGIDSISFIRLLAELEEAFNFEFGYDDIENLKTVSLKTLYEYICNLSE